MTNKTKQATRGRGRPRITSQEAIVAAALELAAGDPAGEVSVAAVAMHLGIAPMALYNYFPNKGALMHAVSATLLGRMKLPRTQDESPIERICHWCGAVRRHFLRHPELLGMLVWEDGHTAPAWINVSAPLLLALEHLGYRDAELAKAARWVWGTTMSAIMIESHYRKSYPRLAGDARDLIDPQIAPAIDALEAFVGSKRHYDEFFDFHLERLRLALPRRTRR